jgi:beta-1,2-mannobiose phosphorylase / 1,2-beta-oligomannan phosphorylase
MKNLFKVWLLAMALAFGAMQAFGQFTWTKDARNPVFSGVNGTWSTHVFCPCVLFNSDSARYEMWFSATIGPSAYPNYRPYSVGRAISKDGINWTMYPSVVVSPDAGKWDNVTIDAPEVIRENGQYKMWYTSWKDNTSPNYLGYATSSDGIHWTKYSGNPIFGPGPAAWEAGGPWFVSILPFQGGYKMWYTGYTADFGTTAIGYATSADGINWKRDTVHSPVLNVGPSGQWDDSYVREPNVLAIGDSCYMWYVGDQTSGYGRTGLAGSKDGINTWTKYGANPVVVPAGAGTWDAERTCVGTVLRVGDTLHMWYDGWRPPHTSYQYSIGHATSPLSPIAAPVLLSPPNGVDSQVTTLLLTWRKISGALTYQVQVGSDGGFTTPLFDDSTVTDTSKLINNLAASTKYYWRVKGRDSDRSSTYSTPWTFTTGTVSVQQGEELPTHYSLGQNYPNPFNPTTGITYQVPGASDVKLVVYDLLGREVAVLVNERKTPGRYEVKFDGNGLASGVYLYRLTAGLPDRQAGTFSQVRKMVLLR